MADPARAYRQFAGQGASLVNLVLQSYDQILNALYAAIRAIEAHRIEQKTKDLNHALLLVGHLQNALDFKAGPQVARNLERFYNLARTRIIQASAHNSCPILRQVAQDFLSIRGAWEQVEKSVASAEQAHSATPAQPSPRSATRPSPYGSTPAGHPHDPIDWSA
ncbi:MAG: flagellar export chaperone FliS [Terriglobia bacterium]